MLLFLSSSATAMIVTHGETRLIENIGYFNEVRSQIVSIAKSESDLRVHSSLLLISTMSADCLLTNGTWATSLKQYCAESVY